MFYAIISEKKFLISFVFLASVFCSILFLVFLGGLGPSQHGVPNSDYKNLYEPVAQNLLEGKGLTLEGKVPVFAGLGFPVILSGIFALSEATGMDRFDLIVVFNIIFAALSAVFLFLLILEMFGKKISLIVSLLWISYPFSLWFVKSPNSEVPFFFFLFLGLFLYALAWKKRSFKFIFFSGLVLGFAAFIRIIGLFLPLLLAFLIFFLLKSDFQKRKIILSSVLILGVILALLPWAVYSFFVSGEFLSLPSLGSRGVAFGITFLAAQGEGGDRIVLSEGVENLIEKVKRSDLSSPIKIVQFFGKETLANPLPVFSLFVLKAGRVWYATSQQWWEGRILMVQAFYFLFILAGLFYGLKFHRDKLREIIFILTITFYFWFMAFINVSIMRYIVPVMALLFVFPAFLISRKLWRH